MSELGHNSVLLNEAVSSLMMDPDGIYVDATFGRGGYTKEMLKEIKNGQVISIDRDLTAIEYGMSHFSKDISDRRLTLVRANYDEVDQVINDLKILEIDGIVFDLGVSSPQFDDPRRGFSYRFNGPLDMRMDQSQELTAYQVINTYSVDQIQRIFRKYGDAPASRRVAVEIISERNKKSIETTQELVSIIDRSLPEAIKRKKGHPAKKFFQALRIEVNGEMDSLKKALERSLEILKVGGILSVVTFQPLEDKLVAQIFRNLANYKQYPRGIPIIPESALPRIEMVHKKSLIPSENEIKNNRRAHSARLRTVRKIRKISFR